MKLIKPCGCEVDLVPILGAYAGTTVPPMQEIPISYCENHTHSNEINSFQDDIVDRIND